MVCVCGGTAFSPEEGGGNHVPGWMGKTFTLPCAAGSLPGLGGTLPRERAFRWHSWELSSRPATAIKLTELWQQLWLISGRNPLECSLSLQHHLHFSQSGWIFCRDRVQAVSFALGSPHKQTFYLEAPARSFAAGCLLFLTTSFSSFVSLMAVWVLETSYTTLFFPSSSIAEQISRPQRRGRRDWCAEPPLPIHLWLGYNRYSWFETAKSLLPNWIFHKLIIAKCSWQRNL